MKSLNLWFKSFHTENSVVTRVILLCLFAQRGKHQAAGICGVSKTTVRKTTVAMMFWGDPFRLGPYLWGG